MLQGVKVDEPELEVINKGTGHAESPVGSLQTRPHKQKAGITEVQVKNAEEISACSEHFKYISTMSSFNDTYFKKTVIKELLNNQKVAWSAFCELSPELV